MGSGSPIHPALVIRGAAIVRDWQDAPALARDGMLARPPGRFKSFGVATADEHSISNTKGIGGGDRARYGPREVTAGHRGFNPPLQIVQIRCHAAP